MKHDRRRKVRILTFFFNKTHNIHIRVFDSYIFEKLKAIDFLENPKISFIQNCRSHDSFYHTICREIQLSKVHMIFFKNSAKQFIEADNFFKISQN